jgi:hypothetical protein
MRNSPSSNIQAVQEMTRNEMKTVNRVFLVGCLALLVSLASCSAGKKPGSASTPSSSPVSAVSNPGGVEKVKPAPGTGNVQGKVLYNSKPAENIEVKLCEKFNQYFGGCSGKNFTARTDKDGEYVITNVAPGVYEALLAKVFDTDMSVFATSGLAGISSTKYDVTADKTVFVTPTNLFKSDLKLLNPKAGQKVSAEGLSLAWQQYPDAAYYKFSIYPDDGSVTSPYINERVDGTTFSVEKPLPKGTYRWQVTAFNGDDKKLAESDRDIKFTVSDGPSPSGHGPAN